ncbi:MAG: type II toxin-antitoxin system death-on-curing family toxin [Bryobacteraceae bacterium]
MTDYLTVVEVLAIHADQIERYGGSHGVRDQGLLEAAMYRPQTGYYVDLIEEAAALWESLAQNHAFIDGNKRTAFAATYTFLAVNGAWITADALKTYAFVEALYLSNNSLSTGLSHGCASTCHPVSIDDYSALLPRQDPLPQEDVGTFRPAGPVFRHT